MYKDDAIIKDTLEDLENIDNPIERARNIQYIGNLTFYNVAKETVRNLFDMVMKELKTTQHDEVKNGCIRCLYQVFFGISDNDVEKKALITMIETAAAIKNKDLKGEAYSSCEEVLMRSFHEQYLFDDDTWKEIGLAIVKDLDPESESKADQATLMHEFRNNIDAGRGSVCECQLLEEEKKLLHSKMRRYYDSVAKEMTGKLSKDSYYTAQIANDIAYMAYMTKCFND